MKEEKTFEEMIDNLEEIAKELESGKLTLDESVQKFEAGMELSKKCSSILENAEKKITMLVKDNEGNLTEENFEVQ